MPNEVKQYALSIVFGIIAWLFAMHFDNTWPAIFGAVLIFCGIDGLLDFYLAREPGRSDFDE